MDVLVWFVLVQVASTNPALATEHGRFAEKAACETAKSLLLEQYARQDVPMDGVALECVERRYQVVGRV